MAQQKLHNKFRTLDDVIGSEKEFEQLRELANNHNIVEEFKRVFPELSSIAEAVKVDNKILFLKVENSVWKSELNFQKSLIVEKINKYFKQQIIKTIKFV